MDGSRRIMSHVGSESNRRVDAAAARMPPIRASTGEPKCRLRHQLTDAVNEPRRGGIAGPRGVAGVARAKDLSQSVSFLPAVGILQPVSQAFAPTVIVLSMAGKP
jgi:hypothetical protein